MITCVYLSKYTLNLFLEFNKSRLNMCLFCVALCLFVCAAFFLSARLQTHKKMSTQPKKNYNWKFFIFEKSAFLFVSIGILTSSCIQHNNNNICPEDRSARFFYPPPPSSAAIHFYKEFYRKIGILPRTNNENNLIFSAGGILAMFLQRAPNACKAILLKHKNMMRRDKNVTANGIHKW